MIGNAIKFTQRGEVDVHVAVKCRSTDGYVLELSVADTGIGIPPEKQRIIFDPFAQADGSTTRRFGGTGLGLTISSRLVALMGGRIELESEIGRGSRFHFDAHFGEVATPASAPPERQPLALNGLAALIVDDNEISRRVLTGLLRMWNMRPQAVDGGPAAIRELSRAVAADGPYTLMLVDQMMPGMDGFALVEELQKSGALANDDHDAHIRRSAGRRGAVPALGDCRLSRQTDQSRRAPDRDYGSPQHFSPRTAALVALGTRARRPSGADPVRGSAATCILLAEDNPVNQRVALHVLQKAGHAPLAVDNGREALAALEREAFDLVLMDVQMPQLDGFEATRAIRDQEIQTGRHLPIIAMTAHAMKGDRERCLDAGMDEYVSKPIQKGELFRAIQAVTRSGRGEHRE